MDWEAQRDMDVHVLRDDYVCLSTRSLEDAISSKTVLRFHNSCLQGVRLMQKMIVQRRVNDPEFLFFKISTCYLPLHEFAVATYGKAESHRPASGPVLHEFANRNYRLAFFVPLELCGRVQHGVEHIYRPRSVDIKACECHRNSSSTTFSVLLHYVHSYSISVLRHLHLSGIIVPLEYSSLGLLQQGFTPPQFGHGSGTKHGK
mmetsp:Transcript_99323/g.186589  ORF Transcript_99323/g.186589 Transcript_99323/m.186589 type:complete len:203 (+) Transcript_99323:750-1358(+)